MSDRPNILFLHVDQMHWDAVSAYGNPYVKTPAVDRIIADGCNFRASYSANPVCCPARGSWYTGRMSCENGQINNGPYPLRADLPDLGAWLRDKGDYETAYSGKWHISRKIPDSFRQIYGQGESKGEIFDPAIGRAAIGYLDNYDSDKPFFLNVGFVNPHDCCYTSGAAGGEGKFLYDEEAIEDMPPIPENFYVHQGISLPKDPGKERYFRYYIYSYYRWMEMVDAEIGRVYDALMGSRFAENTVVIFSSDHGDGLGFHGQVSKSKMEDPSWRVPTVVVTPERERAGEADNEHLSIALDITATICDYAKVPLLPKTIGKSLRPLMEGQTDIDWHEYIVGENWQGDGKMAVRDVQYKTILYGDGLINLFDMIHDPMEMKDLSKTDAGRAVVKKHLSYLQEHLARMEPYAPPNSTQKQPAYTVCQALFSKIEKGEIAV